MPSTPRGYWAEEYPLYHKNQGHFGLSMHATSVAKEGTILPFFRSTEKLVNPENVNVNPRNAGFAEESGISCYIGSIVPKLKTSFNIKLSSAAIETDKIRTAVIYWWPLYNSFVEGLDAIDSKTGDTVSTVVDLVPSTGDKQVKPNYNGTDLSSQAVDDFSSGVEAFGSWGLTTDAKIEGVGMSMNLLNDAFRYYTTKGMIRSILPRMNRVVINRDRSYNYWSRNWTYPKVKRSNEYTFCGIGLFCPQREGADGAYNINHGDTLTNIDHFSISYVTEFEEWNSNFDQGAQ